MGKTKINGKVIQATVDTTELDNLVDNLLSGTAKRVKERIEGELEAVLKDAEEMWPVKTGRSKEALTINTKVTNNSIEVEIANYVDYVYYIKAKELGGKNPWRELILKPRRKLEKKLAEELAEDLLDLASEK